MSIVIANGSKGLDWLSQIGGGQEISLLTSPFIFDTMSLYN